MKKITAVLLLTLICFTSKSFAQAKMTGNFDSTAAELKPYKALYT